MMGSVAQIVTENILQKMEQAEKNGEMFHWVKPFALGAPNRAYSYDTQQAYTGINRILLDSNEYLTYNKVQALTPDYQIRKGAKSKVVCYYSTQPVKDKKTGEIKKDDDGNIIKKGFVKYYRVFSREDVVRRDNGENLPSKFNFQRFSHAEISEQMAKSLDRFNRLFNYYCQKYGITVEIIKDGTQAYFSHDMKIRVPDISNFKSVYDWVTTLAHEMAHSTGMMLGRFEKLGETTTENYSKEELVAEITSQIIANELNIIDDSETPYNAVAYIHSWSGYLRDRPNEIISAASKAEKASKLIMDCCREMELTEQEKNKESEELEL